MATKFADIAKPASTILNDDYTNKVSLKCKKNAGPVAVTIDAVRGKDGAVSCKTSGKFAYAKFSVDKIVHNADGSQGLETSLKLHPDVKLTFKSGKGADLGMDYTKGDFCASGALDVLDMSKFTTSACLAVPSVSGLKVGADASYALSGSSGLDSFTLGASYVHGPVFCSLTANKMQKYNIGLVYQVSPDISLASQTSHTSSKLCTVTAIGGIYKTPTMGTVKAKVDGSGVLSACLVKEVAPKVTLTASGTLTGTDLSTFKPGLGISM